jgi:hypothetical protein
LQEQVSFANSDYFGLKDDTNKKNATTQPSPAAVTEIEADNDEVVIPQCCDALNIAYMR